MGMNKVNGIRASKAKEIRGVPTAAQINLEGDHVQVQFGTEGYDSCGSNIYDLPKAQRTALRAAIANMTESVESLSGSGKPYRTLTVQTLDGTDTVTLSLGGITLPVRLVVIGPEPFSMQAGLNAYVGHGDDDDDDEDNDDDVDLDADDDDDED